MQIRIIKPGLLSTIQDTGRLKYLAQAVPVSGTMDTLSARMANMALGNEDTDAVIEFTYAKAAFKAETELLIAYSGDGAVLKSGDQVIPADRPVYVPAGTVVQLVNNTIGSRTYLAVAGGWNVPTVLGSRSTYITAAIGGLNGRQLQTDDLLENHPKLTATTQSILHSIAIGSQIQNANWALTRLSILPADRNTIRIIPGREFTWFTSRSIIDFLTTPYSLTSQSNRMGYRLQGALLNRRITSELLSTAVAPGTIQVTGGGELILLMADCQTTGGYPRIAQVAAVDLPLCAQLKPDDPIYFKEISYEEADKLYIEQEQQLQKISLAIKNKYI
nr:Allophanate hydrolase subunit 2 [uncultured organism]